MVDVAYRLKSNYAKTPAGIHIAYQVVGDGPIDLVFVPRVLAA